MALDQKVLEDKIASGKELTNEEKTEILKEDGPVEGYAKGPAVETPEKPAAEKDAKPEAEPKAKEKKTEEKPEPADPLLKIETELAKGDGKEDLTTFTEREKAYFHQMRRDRKNRQDVEAERDAALFREAKLKKDLEDSKKSEPVKPAEDDPLEMLKKKDPTDFLTVAEVTKIVEKLSAKPVPAKEEPKEQPKKGDPVQMRYLKMCDDEARAAHPEDYDAVMELTSEILNKNEKYLVAVAQSIEKGENPAIKSYELIKGDTEFAKLFPVAQTKVEARKKAAQKPEEKKVEKTPEDLKKEQDAQKAEEALEGNKNKTKTTGHVGAGEDKPAEELTFQEIAAMSDQTFAKLPKKTRQKYLEMLKEV